MQLRVPPDDIAASGVRLAGDGPRLRGLSVLLASVRADSSDAAGGTGRLASALDLFLDGCALRLGTLAETADLLSGGFARAAQYYRTAEHTAAGSLRSPSG